MVTFNPLPLASQVGLQPAFTVLDKFLPAPAVAAARHLDSLIDGKRRGSVAGLQEQLHRQGDADGAALVTAGWELWRANRHDVERAVNAETARSMWAARLRVTDHREGRRQLKVWAEQSAQLVGPATGVADRVARTINDAAQSVVPPTPKRTPRPEGEFARWH